MSEKCSAGPLRKPVGIEHVDAERVKIPLNRRIEPRAARHQIPHARAKGSVNLPEQDWPGINPNSPQATIDCHQSTHQPRREFSLLVDLLENPFVDQIEELRHHAKGG